MSKVIFKSHFEINYFDILKKKKDMVLIIFQTKNTQIN